MGAVVRDQEILVMGEKNTGFLKCYNLDFILQGLGTGKDLWSPLVSGCPKKLQTREFSWVLAHTAGGHGGALPGHPGEPWPGQAGGPPRESARGRVPFGSANPGSFTGEGFLLRTTELPRSDPSPLRVSVVESETFSLTAHLLASLF